MNFQRGRKTARYFIDNLLAIDLELQRALQPEHGFGCGNTNQGQEKQIKEDRINYVLTVKTACDDMGNRSAGEKDIGVPALEIREEIAVIRMIQVKEYPVGKE